MICKQCKAAFNGTTGVCHVCGKKHDISVIGEVVFDASVAADIVRPVKSKKKAKK